MTQLRRLMAAFLGTWTIAFAFLAVNVNAQSDCARFDDGFCRPGTHGQVRCMVEYDDGTGPALYAGGTFVIAGSTEAQGIARWDGSTWHAVGLGIPGGVYELAVFNDGTGSALYAGGLFQTAGGVPAKNLARWNGSTWAPMGSGASQQVASMVVYDDGTGPALYVAGPIFLNGVLVTGLGKWNGVSWTAVGPGGGLNTIDAVAVHNFGAGPRLVVAGSFTHAGTVPANNIAVWNGSTWSALGSGLNERVFAVTTYGSDLIAAGSFYQSGGSPMMKVSRWNGSSWQGMGGGLDNTCYTLRVEDLGAGPVLFAAGAFQQAGGVSASNVASWDGTAWSALGSGTDQVVFSLSGVQEGSTRSLFVGGSFQTAGGLTTSGIARWNNGWSPITTRAANGTNSKINSLLAGDLGGGPKLYCGGSFTRAGSVGSACVASWDGSSWSPMGSGVGILAGDHVDAMALYDDGSGTKLYVGGYFRDATLTVPSYIASWDGVAWSWVGFGVDNEISAMAVFDEGAGPRLFVGGVFQDASGIPCQRMARWDGTTWSPVGGGMDARVLALAAFDDGSGPALYAGGQFTTAGGIPCSYIAKWNGTTWAPLASTLNGVVGRLSVLDDGSGPALYAVGGFTMAGATPVNHIARLRNGVWSALSGGAEPQNPKTIGVHDDGSGPALYVGGTELGSSPTLSTLLSKWDGSTWTTVPETFRNPGSSAVDVSALCSFDYGAPSGASLFVGGSFSMVGAVPSIFLAEYQGCAQPFTNMCAGDGTGTACPCGNSGAVGVGCANSIDPNGGRLQASGVPRIVADTLSLTATGVPNGPGLYFQGTTAIAGGNGAPFGDGLRCAGGAILRLGVIIGSGGTSQYPRPGGDPSVSLAGFCTPGSVRTYQVWYRDSSSSYCSPSVFNLTNGVQLMWRP